MGYNNLNRVVAGLQRFFEQVVTSLQITSCNQPDLSRLVAYNLMKGTSLLQFVDKLQQAGKIAKSVVLFCCMEG